jgi:hypothetical protein
LVLRCYAPSILGLTSLGDGYSRRQSRAH